MRSSNLIPDLHYIVIPSRVYFARAGHATVFYRHDKDGKPFIYHVATFYGHDGRITRASARRYGAEIVGRVRALGLRNAFVKVDDRPTVRAAGLDPRYAPC